MQTLFQLSASRREEVKEIIEPKPRQRKVSLQVVGSGILYLLEKGGKWEGLPPVYGYVQVGPGLLSQVLGLWGLEKRRYTLNPKLRVEQENTGQRANRLLQDLIILTRLIRKAVRSFSGILSS